MERTLADLPEASWNDDGLWPRSTAADTPEGDKLIDAAGEDRFFLE